MYTVGIGELSWGDSVERKETRSGQTWPANEAEQGQLARWEALQKRVMA